MPSKAAGKNQVLERETMGFDAIVIGSGFGGAVTACRLAEKGKRVLILERGRSWDKKDYPRKPDDAWIWDNSQPEKLNGWLDFRVFKGFFKGMTVIQGSGVGGGSLIYANVSVEAVPACFDKGWPEEITYATIKPHYDRVGKMLNVHTIPVAQATKRYHLMQKAAAAIGVPERFRPVPLAVTFSDKWSEDLDDCYHPKHSETHINAHGVEQGTCIHCGNCDIGCPVQAKNTLDLNYLAVAKKHGAEIRPLHMVENITKENGGYRVHFHRLVDGEKIPGSESAKIVILAAGSLGSTEILLRCRDEHHSLTGLSPTLGTRWSSNGDFLTPALHKEDVSPTQGPTITSAIDFLDGSVDGQKFFIEDGGFPDVLGNFLEKGVDTLDNSKQRLLLKIFGRGLRSRDPIKNIMPWFAQGVDGGDGQLHLARPWWKFWGKKELQMRWNLKKSEGVIKAIVAMHEKLAKATGGEPLVPPSWRYFRDLITPHPLGGCRMAKSIAEGVVDHKGEVFGHKGLYVADGAIVPVPIGLNPSRTIAALAERIAEHIV